MLHLEGYTMNWSEDSWEDVSDPPSPIVSNAVLQFFQNDLLSDQLPEPETESQILHNGHVPFLKSARNGSRVSHFQANKSDRVESCDSEIEHSAGKLLGPYHSGAPQNSNSVKVPYKIGHITKSKGNSISSGPQRTTSAEPAHQRSFKSASSDSRSIERSGSSSGHKLTQTGHRLDVRYVTSDQHSVPEVKVPRVNTPPEVPQQTRLKSASTGKESSGSQNNGGPVSGTGMYSKSTPRNGAPKRDYSLHEYEKQKLSKPPRVLARYSTYHPDNLTDGRSDNFLIDDDEDRVNAIICLVFCVMGIGFIVGLIFVLIHFAETKEQEQIKTAGGEETYTQMLNTLYYGRIATIITAASVADQARLHRIESTQVVDQTVRQYFCEREPSELVGNATDIDLNVTLDINTIIKDNSDVQAGGEWKPPGCVSRHRVAIVIPYRDRWDHLKVLLHYLIPILKRQEIHFRVFVVEQYGNETFNKGRIMNAAFREALKLFDFRCVTFHDVDLVPEDDRNMYSCTEQPKHMSFSIDKFHYVLPYEGLVGGVLMFKREHFELVNGYSNMYWGWGAEDDDMTARILHHGLRVYRPPCNIAKYKMVKHDGRSSSEVSVRMKLLRSAARRSKLEGLNNVQYKLLTTHIERLFTHLLVDIGHP